MTRTMKLLTATLLVAMAFGANTWSPAEAADDAHQHAQTPAATTATTSSQPDREASANPMPLSAEDMLRKMETMPAHDDAHCCGIQGTKKNAHGHGH